jgi:hypothetical protein
LERLRFVVVSARELRAWHGRSVQRVSGVLGLAVVICV